MASTSHSENLICSICLDVYTDPVTLQCGHSFCQGCINKIWDNQTEVQYCCPKCQQTFHGRPTPQRKPDLRTRMETFPSKHLGDPNSPAQMKTLDGSEDADCVSDTCSNLDNQQQLEILNVALEEKKEKWRQILQEMICCSEVTESKVCHLQEHKRDVTQKSAMEADSVTTLVRDLRRQLDILETQVLAEISRQEENALRPVCDFIGQLEMKRGEISGKIQHLEYLCNTTDPMMEVDNNDFVQVMEGGKLEEEKVLSSAGDIDPVMISLLLQKGLEKPFADFQAQKSFYVQKTSFMFLDENTAGPSLLLSRDMKTARCTQKTLPERLEMSRQFMSNQILGTRMFSSGRYYWEVEIKPFADFSLGVAYPTIEREGRSSGLGFNNKSWALAKGRGAYYVTHNSKETELKYAPSTQSVGVFLDIEAGRLSFYELCDPIKHIHTFTATFTEPVLAAFRLYKPGEWVTILS